MRNWKNILEMFIFGKEKEKSMPYSRDVCLKDGRKRRNFKNVDTAFALFRMREKVKDQRN
jgi:hypothetical protein